MNLSDWLTSNGISQVELSIQIDVTQSFVSKVISGEKRFSPDVARRVVDLTGGQVTLEELLFPDDFKKASDG